MTYNQQPPTKSGYCVWERQSALQKCIRRGEEKLAMRFAMEMESAGWFNAAVQRLRVISFEDIGPADPMAVMHARNALDFAADCYAKKKRSWKLGIANACVVLARAAKSRIADELQMVTITEMANGVKPLMPDVALDKHTRRGKKMGRSFEHFVKEGTICDPPTVMNEYKADAERAWLTGATVDDSDPDSQPPQQQTLL